MRKILKAIWNITQISVKLVLALFIVFSSYTYLNQVFYNREVYTASDYRSYPNDSIDVLVLGSSHAQYSFVPGFFYEETGLYSYILGSSCQPLKVSYQMLKEGLKTQSPKAVILEAYTSMPLKSICEDDSCYVRAEYEMTGEEKYETISYLPGEKAEQYYNDYINYHNDWRTMTDYSQLLPVRQQEEEESGIIASDFGYVYNEPAWNYKNFWYPTQFGHVEATELLAEDREALDNILALCQQKGILLILYKSPMDGIDEENQAYLEAVWKWADENGIRHIDFNEESPQMGYFMNVHSDSYHAYVNGAYMITSRLADMIRHSSVEFSHAANAEMDRHYRHMAQKYTVRYLRYEVSPFIYLNRYIETDGYVILRYHASDVLPEDSLQYYLREIMRSQEEFDHDLFAIVHDRETIFISQTSFDYEINGHHIGVDQNQAYLDGHPLGHEGMLSLTFVEEDCEEWTTNNIEYRGYTWTWGYHYYTKD